MMIEEDLSFRLSWKQICAVACAALCRNMTFEQLCVEAIKDRLKVKT